MKKSSFLLGGALLLVSLFTTSCKEVMGSLDNPVPSYLSLATDSIGLSFGASYKITPNSINDKTAYTYQSMDERVVKVDGNGLVTAVGPGETGVIVRQDADAEGNYKFSQVELKVTVPSPLTLEANANGKIKVLFNDFETEAPICYTIAGAETKAITTDTDIEVKKGDKVYFTSANEALAPDTWNFGVQIKPQMQAYIYGNLMSMISPDGNYIDNKTITKPFAFFGLFCDAWNIYTNWQDKIELPATTLTASCYNQMFYNTGISEAPELPATKMEPYCYQGMFMSCWNINNAPKLPAMKLADGCYGSMFARCGSLWQAPELPATELAPWCYQEMFWNCYNLNEGPVLPAKTLKQGCYDRMFAYCYSMTSLTCLATTLSGEGYDTEDWLFRAGYYPIQYNWGVTPTLKKAASVTTWSKAADWETNGWQVPAGWNIENAN